jgi:hypothetical protein
MSVLRFIDWCNSLGMSVAVRKSTWMFPIIEVVHLLGLGLLLGTLTIVSLRVFGFVLKGQTVYRVASELEPWTLGGLCVMLVTGPLLFLAEPRKCYDSPPFRLKMICLFVALIFHFTLFRRIIHSADNRPSWPLGKLGVGFSLMLWFAVGLAGRAIGFY